MTNWKRIISLMVAVVLLVNASASALADNVRLMTQTELEAAWALTGLDENAAQYREGMAFSEHMNAQQLKCWLDELLEEEMSGLKQLYSALENNLYEIEQENGPLYKSMTQGSNAANYQRLLDTYDEMENLRQRIRYLRDQLDINSSVISSRIEVISSEDASDSARLTASWKIEEAVKNIKAIRAEVSENAANWLNRMASLHASMTVSGSANGLRSTDGGDQADWIDSILTYRTAEPVSVQVSASVLYPGSGLTRTARLLPVSSALADSSSKITVDVMDANSIVLKFVDAADNTTPLANVTVTLNAGGLKETVTSNERGNVIFSADKHNINGNGEVTGSVDVKAEGYRDFCLAQTTFTKGETRTYPLTKDDGKVYLRGAFFENNNYKRDVLMDTYTAFHSAYNDESFSLGITASRQCKVTLTYIALKGEEGEEKTLEATTDKNGYVNFNQQWKSMVKPGKDSVISISLKEGEKEGETRKLGLSFVKGVLDLPITSVTDIMKVFSGVGLSFSLPSDLFKPLGGMTFSVDIPFVEKLWWISAVGTLDGTFLIYVGKNFQPQNIGKLKTSWKTMDQKDLETEVKTAERWSYREQLEKANKGLTDLFNKERPIKIPFLGSAQLSFCLGGSLMGKFAKAGDYNNWQYSFKAILSAMASLDVNYKIFFIQTPPIFLNISIQACAMFAVQFAFQAAMKDGVATGLKVDWGAFGFSLTFRLSVSIGVSVGIPGLFTITVGGFVWFQIFLGVTRGRPVEFRVSFGGGAFLEVKIWFFTYKWNIYDSGERMIYPKKASSNALPWYDNLLSLAQAEGEESRDGENDAVSLLPDDYSALAPSAKLEMGNFSLGDSNVKFITAGGNPYMFYIEPGDGSLSRGKVVCRNMKTGETETLFSDKNAEYYTFDVEVQHPSERYVSLGYDASKDIVIIAAASAREFEKKEIIDANGQKQTISVPKNAELTYMGRYFSSTGAGGFVGLPLGTFTLDKTLNNLQLSFWQGMNLATPTFYVQFLMDDMFGDKNEREYVTVLYDAYSTKDIMHPHRRGQRVIQDAKSKPGVSYQQIMGADMTPGYQRGENPSTLYLLQDGKLLRKDYYIGSGSQEGAHSITISDANVSFFTVFDDTNRPYHPTVFYLEDEEVTAKGEEPSLIHHLKAAQLSFQEDVGKADWASLVTADLDVTIPGGDFQVQLISDTIYLYWLETAPKDKAGDPDEYRLRCAVYDPDTMVATDDFVMAEFSAEPGTRPANLYLAETGTGYYVRWNSDGTASVYSFSHKLVPHADLRGVTSAANMVRVGTDVDFYLSVMNDGNTNLSELDLEMVIQDERGNVIKGRNGNEVRERFHLNLLYPERSSRTVYGDSVKTNTGEEYIYRMDDLTEPIRQNSFNVSKKAYSILFENYAKKEVDSSVTFASSRHILPGETISLTMSVHIPTDLQAGNAANIVIRLADRQANALTGYGVDEVIVDRTDHDLDVGHRVYITPEGEERLAVTIYDHASSGESVRLYAEMYLDNSPDPIYVDLPYYPELVSADMTHNLDIPVAALLNGNEAQKVEMRILAAGVREDFVRNNAFTFYVMNYTAPLRFLYQPVDTSALPGGEAVFSVTASGGLSPYEYQWQEYLGADLGWKNIDGAEESALKVQDVKQSMNGRQYRCVVKDHNMDEITSDGATLNVVSVLPPTGDHTNLLLYVSLAAAALLLAAAVHYARKKREQKA